MSRTITGLISLAFFLFLDTSQVQAQSQQSGPVHFSADGGAVHQSDADLKDGGGSFTLDRWFLSAGISYAWSPRNSFGLTFGGGGLNYDFDPESGFGGGDPWDKVEDFRISAPMRFQISETVTGVVIPTLRYNREKGADSGDSQTWGVFAAAAWRVNEGLTIGPGMGVFSKLDDDTRVFPILVIDWDISEKWNLSTGSGLAASQGPGLTLGYKASQRWTVGLSGRYEDVEFRLDNEGPSPGGIGRDQSLPIVVSGVFDANEMVSLSIFAGLELGGKLKLKNDLGEVLEETDYDPAALFGVTFNFRY